MDNPPSKLPPTAWLLAIAVVAFLAGGIAGAGAGLLVGGSDDTPDTTQTASENPRVSADAEAAVQATASALPGIVTIINEIAPTPALPGGGIAGGGGVIVDDRGFVLTNEHIVHEPGKLTVVLNNGEKRSATIVSHDAPFTDVAVLRINGGGLKAVPMGKSEDLQRGETVIAIGSPDFDYANSVTVGVVSGTERRKKLNGVFLDDLIQTDAAINSGNSGGPLINLRGEIVGIVTFRDVGGDDDLAGISFALSTRRLKPIVQAMIDRGMYTRPYFGIEHQNIDPEFRAANGLRQERGALVRRVFDASPAQKAGLRPGDVIVRIGRNDVTDNMPFLNALALAGANERVPVQIVRDGRTTEVTVETTPR